MKEYHTVVETQVETFDGVVQVMLNIGWELYGHPYSIQSDNESGFCQALTKDKED